MWRGDPERAITCGNEALLLLPARSTRWFQVIGVLAVAAGRHSNGYELQRLCDLLREIGEQGESSDAFIIAATRATMQTYVAGDYPRALALFNVLRPHMQAAAGTRSPAAEAMVSMLRGSEATINWQLDKVPLHFEQAADLFEAIGDLRNACSQRLDAAIFYLDTASYARSERLLRQIIDLSDRFGFHRLSSVATRSLASVLRLTDREDECVQYANRAISLAGPGGDLRVSGTAHVLLAQVFLKRGDLVAASQEAERGAADLARIPRFLARALAVQSRIKLMQGDLASALRSAAQAFAILQALTRLGTDEVMVRTSYADVLEKMGVEASARSVLIEGRARLLHQAGCIQDLAVRTQFLAQPELAEFLARTEKLLPATTPPTMAETAAAAGETAASGSATKPDTSDRAT
jgi:tetratricopeptide (TPR) repeat protein